MIMIMIIIIIIQHLELVAIHRLNMADMSSGLTQALSQETKLAANILLACPQFKDA
jgi:hypothetical protein